ncbi:MAG: ABC transporter ATP-binding protein, partial [Nitratireductor sp.]|nr:ABC transporter ATP-binding protein [Nitratireductor sp.]
VFTVLSVNLLGDVVRDSVGRGIAVRPLPASRASVPGNTGKEGDTLARATGNDILRIKDLGVAVRGREGGEVPVITGLSLSIARGETLGLVGESGCGKTLTGLSILDLIGVGGRSTHGSIRLGGKELRGLGQKDMAKVRGNEVAMVFQDPTTSLNPAYAVGNQIAEVLRTKMGMSKRQAWARTVELIDRVGIPRPAERANAFPHELSGGMAQRIAIARALSCNPKLLIADEPTTALDVTVQQEILDLFRDLQDEYGMAILFVTHDLAVAADICDRIAVMYAGEIVELAPVDELFAQPHHPYTAGLLSATTHASNREPPLPTIKGAVPAPRLWPEGCRFAERCEFRKSICEKRVTLTGSDRLVRCVRAEELDLRVAS